MRPPRRLAAAALGAVVVIAALWLVPAGLRRLAFFRVREVELVGLRHLAPETVLAALRLRPNASVFDDLDLVADRVRGLSGVAEARVGRRLPQALRVEIVEVAPVAFVPGGRGMVVVDAGGRPLPFDPARPSAAGGLDLPVAVTADSALVSLLARVAEVDPTLFRQVTTARRTGRNRGDCLLEFGSRRVWLRPDAGPEVIQAVVRVTEDLAAKRRAYVELDARYAGQIVVRRRASA